MSDERLDAKFAALTAGPLGEARSWRLLAALRGIDDAEDLSEVAALLSPELAPAPNRGWRGLLVDEGEVDAELDDERDDGAGDQDAGEDRR